MFVGEAPGREEDIGACPSSDAPANCSTGCSRRSGSTAPRLHRQCRALAAARQPHADAAGDADLPAVHPAADRARQSGRAGDPRQSLGADAAVDERRHHAHPRPLVRLRHRHASIRAWRHSIRPISCAHLVQAAGLAGSPRDREGAGSSSRTKRAPYIQDGARGTASLPPLHEVSVATAPSAARWPSRSATTAGGRSPASRTTAALPAPGRETAARVQAAGCLMCRRRARPRRRRFR